MKPSGAHCIQGEGESWICSSLSGEDCVGLLLLSTAASREDLKKTETDFCQRDAVAGWEVAAKRQDTKHFH